MGGGREHQSVWHLSCRQPLLPCPLMPRSPSSLACALTPQPQAPSPMTSPWASRSVSQPSLRMVHSCPHPVPPMPAPWFHFAWLLCLWPSRAGGEGWGRLYSCSFIHLLCDVCAHSTDRCPLWNLLAAQAGTREPVRPYRVRRAPGMGGVQESPRRWRECPPAEGTA